MSCKAQADGGEEFENFIRRFRQDAAIAHLSLSLSLEPKWLEPKWSQSPNKMFDPTVPEPKQNILAGEVSLLLLLSTRRTDFSRV